ncbi:MAG: hypothetical protein Unbinned221contig1000_9 [Prokaryotic dsDNA virus sp.]|nr:MAG: hypothetical protein Unbinned221contig1000_9 [Prokaryotic dsDNA virus sp.]|tara:strand:+ start:1241 stop:2311 length:1071 start_codon:yes stop_codon:yes gene_type:complete
MSRIFTRSPFIIDINESGQTGSKVELTIWSEGDTEPTTPTYTLTKNVPSSTDPLTTYNVSPFIREYINLSNTNGLFNTYNVDLNSSYYANVRIKRFKDISGSFSLLNNITYKAFDGFGLFTEGYNVDLGRVLLSEGVYTYHLPDLNNLSEDKNKAGDVTIMTEVNDIVRYTNLSDGTITNETIPTSGVRVFPRVHHTNLEDGNKFQLVNSTFGIDFEATFKPVCEKKYTPIFIDYVNRFGAWSRTFLYKVSNETFNASSKDFNSLHSSLVNYSVREAQMSSFNFNGSESIEGNSGFVSEDFSEEIKQIMLSERVLVNGRPAKIDTKSIDVQKSINNRNINYKLKFNFANNYMNNIV